MKINPFRLIDGKDFRLDSIKTDDSGGFEKGSDVDNAIACDIRELAKLQDILYAHNKYGVLIILQDMDTASCAIMSCTCMKTALS